LTIIFPRTLPNLRFRTSTFIKRDVTSDIPSPFTGHSDVIVWPGQWFESTLTLVPMKRGDTQVWDAWLSSMRGKAGTFLLGDPAKRLPLGSAAVTPGAPRVFGAGQSGGELRIAGCPFGAPTYLKAGDMLQLATAGASRLHMALEDVATNGSGEALFAIWPELREPPVDASPVTVINPRGVFHRTSDLVEIPTDTAGFSNIAFDVKEALRA
jgi:hypothetical protein